MRRLIEFFRYTPQVGKDEWVRIDKYKPGPDAKPREAFYHVVGVLVNPHALWVGGHYSAHHKRWCINILPCLTVWWTKPGGYLP